jgi:hypothetical protein
MEHETFGCSSQFACAEVNWDCLGHHLSLPLAVSMELPVSLLHEKRHVTTKIFGPLGT